MRLTWLMGLPVCPLTVRATVPHLVTGAAALVLPNFGLLVFAPFTGTCFHDTGLGICMAVRPIPNIFLHPGVLREPKVIMRVLGTIHRARGHDETLC